MSFQTKGLLLFQLILYIGTGCCITCNDIMREGSVKEFSKEDLITLSSNTEQQLETCLYLLGKDEIDKPKAKVLWTVIKEVYGSVSDITDDTMKQLGWIITGIDVDDFHNITITDIDTVSILGNYRNLSNSQLIALKRSIDNQWSRKTPEELTSYDLIALRQILCVYNQSEIAAIHPDSYRDAASDLSTLKNCPKSALTQLVSLAVKDDAFGNPNQWSSIQVTSVGCVMAGLQTAKHIPAESMEGITPDIVSCLPSSFLQTMTEDQLQHFTTNAASSVSAGQIKSLSSAQKDALQKAIVGVTYIRRSTSSTNFLGIHASENCDNVETNSSANGYELFTYLTHPCHYDKYTAPSRSLFKQKPDVIRVRVHVYHFQFLPKDNVAFEVQLLIQLKWTDPRLQYENKTNNVTLINGEDDFVRRIWTPNVYFTNERALLINKHNMDTSLIVLPTGVVLFTSRVKTTVSCWDKVGRFPLDIEKCNLNIDTWKFTSNVVVLKWEKGSAITFSECALFLAEYQLSGAVQHTDYEFVEPDSINSHVYNCSSLTVEFLMAREYGYYILNYYVPSVLMVVISWVTFWESPDAVPGRMILGTGTMLTFISLGVEVSKSLPTVSYVRSNDLWFIGCTVFIFCSMAEFAFVNTLWRYGGQVEMKKMTSKYILKSSLKVKPDLTTRRRSLSLPSSPTASRGTRFKQPIDNERTVKSLSDLDLWLPLSELKTVSRETLNISEKSQPAPATMTMREIATWIDKKSRIAFPVSFLIFNLGYWCLLIMSS